MCRNLSQNHTQAEKSSTWWPRPRRRAATSLVVVELSRLAQTPLQGLFDLPSSLHQDRASARVTFPLEIGFCLRKVVFLIFVLDEFRTNSETRALKWQFYNLLNYSGCRGLSFEFIFASPSHRIRYFCRSSTFDALTSLLGFSLEPIGTAASKQPQRGHMSLLKDDQDMF